MDEGRGCNPRVSEFESRTRLQTLPEIVIVNLTLNENDTIVYRTWNSKRVTGVVVNGQPQILSPMDSGWPHLRWLVRKEKVRRPDDSFTVWIPGRCIVEINGQPVNRDQDVVCAADLPQESSDLPG